MDLALKAAGWGIIEIEERERYRVQLFMEAIDQNQKTLVFCASQPRVLAQKSLIFSRYIDKQQEFIDFVLEQYIKVGVGELNKSKLPQLLELKYHAVRDAVEALGSVANISEVFIGFQQYLYSQDMAA